VEERGAANTGWLFVQFMGDLLDALPGVTDLQVERSAPGPPAGFSKWPNSFRPPGRHTSTNTLACNIHRDLSSRSPVS
jgi:hypothetical protein